MNGCPKCGKSVVEPGYCGLCVDIMEHMDGWQEREKERIQKGRAVLTDFDKVDMEITCHTCRRITLKRVEPRFVVNLKRIWKNCEGCAYELKNLRSRIRMKRFRAEKRRAQSLAKGQSPAASRGND